MSTLTTYARAALPLVPGASRLPFVAGGGSEMPDIELIREGVETDRDHLAAYAAVCGFTLGDVLPPTYPHIHAFPLHMQVMTDGRFPFPAVGLVHIENEIEQRRPIGAAEPLDVRVHPTPIEPHPKGRAFSLVTEVRASGDVAWVERSTMLRRGRGEGDAVKEEGSVPPQRPPFVAEWRLPGDLGRRYGGVSGDRNPIHIHRLTARAFGFPRAIAHGMWTKARCLAALEARLPESYTVRVDFRKPIMLPGRVAFAAATEAAPGRFDVRDAKRDEMVHLEGEVTR
jgi:acyl dehydratase